MSDFNIPDLDRAIKEGLLEAGEVIGEESDRIAPIEEGTLIRSRTVTTTPIRRRQSAEAVAAIAYDTPYAARQHEDLTYEHDPGRQAKFLEQSMRVHGERAWEHIADKIRGELR